MTSNQKAKIIVGVMAIFVTLPIWFFLLYQVLSRINANELMWFLYWIYVPVTILASVIKEITGAD